jgi:hypothetical protein
MLTSKAKNIKTRWITQGIKNSSRRMRLLQKHRKEINLEQEELPYINTYRHIYRNVIKEAKTKGNGNYLTNGKNKTKASWQIINNEMGRFSSRHENIELMWNSCKITNPKITLKKFNSYFIEIAEKLTDHTDTVYRRYQGYSWKLNRCPNTMFLNPVSEDKIKYIINNLKGRGTSGIDRIVEKVVKRSTEYIIKPLTNICNASFKAGVFPDRLKIVAVKPIHEKGSKEDIKTYRPISLLPVFSKITERAMYIRLKTFITYNNILVEAQNGFREGRSTESAIQTFLDNIFEALDTKIMTTRIF